MSVLIVRGPVLYLEFFSFCRNHNPSEASFIKMIFHCFLRLTLAMNDKHLSYLFNSLTTCKVLYHLRIISMSRKTLYLGHLSSDSVVIAKYTHVAQPESIVIRCLLPVTSLAAPRNCISIVYIVFYGILFFYCFYLVLFSVLFHIQFICSKNYANKFHFYLDIADPITQKYIENEKCNIFY